MSNHLFSALVDEVGIILRPLLLALDDPQELDSLLEQLSTDTETIGEVELLNALRAVTEALQTVDELRTSPPVSLDALRTNLRVLGNVFATIRSLPSTPNSYPELGADLAELLTMIYLRSRAPVLFQIGVTLGLIDFKSQPFNFAEGSLTRLPPPVLGFNLTQLRRLLTDPVTALREPFPSSPLGTVVSANETADLVMQRIGGLLTALEIPWLYGFPAEESIYFEDAAPFMDHALLLYAPPSLLGNSNNSEAGLCLVLSPADRDHLGLVVTPFGGLNIRRQISGWDFDLALLAEVRAIAMGGSRGFQALSNGKTGKLQVSFKAVRPRFEEEPAFVFGAANATRLELGGTAFKADTSLSESQQSLALSADVSTSALVIAPGDGDGFLQSILPAEGIKVEFDLGLAWSNERGLTFRGAGSLDATIPLGLSIRDVFRVPTIYLGLRANETGLSAEVSASVGLTIGPVEAVIDRVGLASKVTFPETGGNLGVADLDLRFKPPTGIGLSIDASMVVGGGFVSLDSEKGEYSGVLQLEIADRISVKAIGILTTRMPGGAKGYSFVALIFAEGFAIQLGLGFALTGIGGLLAINRTFDEDALRGGLKNHMLDGVMFPKDPIRNAPEIISNLNKVFPPASGHHLFGPMLQISWGTPALITANLAVIVEFGARARLLILAQLLAILPRRENDLVRLQMDAIGVLDFDQGRASLDATLHDSRLLKKFVLTGDMAMRLKWKGSPNFALAVGGLHPAFNPPPAFPKLDRIAINLSSGNNPRFRLEAYFALTSNTVQFGARAELYIEAAGFSLHGEIGFDVLIQFAPFFFQAGFDAQLQLKRGSTNLLKIRVEGSFAGPRPLHIMAKATFEILWWDVSISVDKTLVEGEKPPPPEPVDVLPRLKEALGNAGNWISQLPDGQRQVVTLRAKTGGPTDVLLHPLGTLIVKQNVVPLDLDISRFGQATPAGARHFSISCVTVGGLTQTAIKDFFAPAEFLEMTDDEKLSRPSFEQMSAGLRFASSDFTFTTESKDWLEADAIEFETLILDENMKPRPRKPEAQETFYKLPHDRLAEQSRFGAAGLSELRRTGKNKYRTSRVAHTLSKEGWSIVATDDLTVQPVAGIAAGQPTNYSQAAEALRNLKRVDPAKAASLKILRLSELSKN